MTAKTKNQRDNQSDCLFPMGQIAATRGVIHEISHLDLAVALARHHNGDWGDCGAEDWERNQQALKDGSRLFSVYHSGKGKKFWIITEADRSVTTVLFPSDY